MISLDGEVHDPDAEPALSFANGAANCLKQFPSPQISRPLGATLGDTLTKAPAEGGLGLGRIGSSLVIAVAMIVLIAVTSLRKRASIRPSFAPSDGFSR